MMQKNITESDFDLIIIGGGLAGASLACALIDTRLPQPLKIAVVEAFKLDTDSQPCYDDRTVALSYGSSCIFESMGVWQALLPYAEAIDNIHISDRGHLGVTRLSKEQEGVEALGYVLENRVIGHQLYAAMSRSASISLFCPAKVDNIEQTAQRISVGITQDGKAQRLNARLLVAADGNNSQIMQLLNIGSSRKNYQQSALITNVSVGKGHNNVAYERFTEEGPLAFLPMSKNRCSVVWTVPPERADALLTLDDNSFCQRLQQRFGFRLGQIKKVGTRQVYPLFLQSATQMMSQRVAVIGNAAHSVHPVAGQGFNLALRDVALLSELIVRTAQADHDIGSQTVLQQYVQQREDDIQQVYRFTDVLVRTFSNTITPLAHMRSLSLFLVDLLPDIKHRLAKQSMGLNGRLTRLGRGLGL